MSHNGNFGLVSTLLTTSGTGSDSGITRVVIVLTLTHVLSLLAHRHSHSNSAENNGFNRNRQCVYFKLSITGQAR